MEIIPFITIISICFIGGFLGGYYKGHDDVEKRLKNEAIKKGHAEYNTTTGKWQWKTP